MLKKFKKTLIVLFDVWMFLLISAMGVAPVFCSTYDMFPSDDLAYAEKLYDANIFPDEAFQFAQVGRKLYAADCRRALIYRLDVDLNKIGVFGGLGQGPGKLDYIQDFAVSRNHVYVLSRQQIHVFDSSGKFEKIIRLDQINGQKYSIAVDMKDDRVLLLMLNSPDVYMIGISDEKIESEWRLPPFNEGSAPTDKRMDRCICCFVGDKVCIARVSFPEIMVFSETGKLKQRLSLIPDRESESNYWSEFYERTLAVASDDPLPRTTLQLRPSDAGVDVVTGSYLASVNLDTGDVAFRILYQPVSDHLAPEKLSSKIIRDGHFPGLVMSGGWWINKKFVAMMFGDSVHAYSIE